MSNTPHNLPGTGLAVTSATSGGTETTRVYYQDIRGGVFEIVGDGSSWAPGTDALFQAAPNTPLAAINWDNGEEVRVYYLDEKYTVQEFCYSAESGKWTQGHDLSSFVQVAPKSSLAAFCYTDTSGLHIRVYCQEAESLKIQEIANDGSRWTKGSTLVTALDGTSIAATVYNSGIPAFRVYYQLDDLTLQEQMRNGSAAAWTTGGFKPGDAPAGTPITVLGVNNTDLHLRVYWMNVQRDVIHAQTPAWNYDSNAIVNLPFYVKITVSQVNNGASIRLYYQREDTSVVEIRGDGAVWGGETIVAKA